MNCLPGGVPARNKKQTGSKFAKIRRSAICNMNFFALELCSRWFSGGCHSQKGPLEVKSACSLGADLIITPAGCALMPGSPPNACVWSGHPTAHQVRQGIVAIMQDVRTMAEAVSCERHSHLTCFCCQRHSHSTSHRSHSIPH